MKLINLFNKFIVKHGELSPVVLEGNSCVYILQIINNKDKNIKVNNYVHIYSYYLLFIFF
jgi:hypothetical protein